MSYSHVCRSHETLKQFWRAVRSVYSVHCSQCCTGKLISYQAEKLTNHPGRKIQCGLTLYRAAKGGELYWAATELRGELFSNDNVLPTFGGPNNLFLLSHLQSSVEKKSCFSRRVEKCVNQNFNKEVKYPNESQ